MRWRSFWSLLALLLFLLLVWQDVVDASGPAARPPINSIVLDAHLCREIPPFELVYPGSEPVYKIRLQGKWLALKTFKNDTAFEMERRG
jgi:hypothetical protein